MQKKLMKLNDYNDGASFWRVACDCTDPNHDVNLYFEIEDKDNPIISLNLSMEIGARDRAQYSEHYWLNSVNQFNQRLFWRIKTAVKVLFTGYITMSGDVILDKDGITAMQTALDEGAKHFNACADTKTI